VVARDRAPCSGSPKIAPHPRTPGARSAALSGAAGTHSASSQAAPRRRQPSPRCHGWAQAPQDRSGGQAINWSSMQVVRCSARGRRQWGSTRLPGSAAPAPPSAPAHARTWPCAQPASIRELSSHAGEQHSRRAAPRRRRSRRPAPQCYCELPSSAAAGQQAAAALPAGEAGGGGLQSQADEPRGGAQVQGMRSDRTLGVGGSALLRGVMIAANLPGRALRARQGVRARCCACLAMLGGHARGRSRVCCHQGRLMMWQGRPPPACPAARPTRPRLALAAAAGARRSQGCRGG